ncbi:MAG: hypothetical protein DSM106950_38750 [Stigonema ocellatum SAG 48.90 = DSM 106950]|nr:hypothetical protein [Stigonema ocellatum SAG 48.90 = DSM 106950]
MGNGEWEMGNRVIQNPPLPHSPTPPTPHSPHSPLPHSPLPTFSIRYCWAM